MAKLGFSKRYCLGNGNKRRKRKLPAVGKFCCVHLIKSSYRPS